jgi:hypothetical protein
MNAYVNAFSVLGERSLKKYQNSAG